MKKSVNLDMTEGKPLKLILSFSVPILFGNLFQQFYNVMDTAIVGKVLGDHALAAVGATTPFFGLVSGMAVGATNGFSMILSRYFGAKDEEGMKKVLFMIYALTVLLSVVLTFGAVACIEPLLRFLNTPELIMEDAIRYLQVAFGGLVVMMLYNMFAGILRAVGNSVMPLVFLIISSIMNVILDVLFVKGLGLGVAGAAGATVLAQLLSVLLSLWYIVKKCPVFHLERKHMVGERKLAGELLSTAISMAMMLAVVSVGTVALQSAVNSFDTPVIAAHTAARKVDELFMIPLSTLSVTASTYASQNFGAGHMERIKSGIGNTFLLGFIWSTVGVLVAFFAGPYLVKMLTSSENAVVIDTAVQYIRINFPFFYFLVPLLILRSTLQGLGRKVVPLIGSMVELIGKFLVVAFLAPRMGYLGVCISEPVIWIVCMSLVLWDFTVFLYQSKNSNELKEV